MPHKPDDHGIDLGTTQNYKKDGETSVDTSTTGDVIGFYANEEVFVLDASLKTLFLLRQNLMQMQADLGSLELEIVTMRDRRLLAFPLPVQFPVHPPQENPEGILPPPQIPLKAAMYPISEERNNEQKKICSTTGQNNTLPQKRQLDPTGYQTAFQWTSVTDPYDQQHWKWQKW
jgi:hypothetical protein